jgi:hypothetical protein
MSSSTHSRRAFLALLAAAVVPFAAAGAAAAAHREHPPGPSARAATKHPDPRPGIDGTRVLPADEVPADVREVYDGIRRIPHVADGIRCQCGCAELPEMYSLLSCYESSGMAHHCAVCTAVGELVVRLHGEGRTLNEIRAAVDRRSW